MLRSVIRTVVAIGAWGLLHSLLATKTSKRLAAGALGVDARNGVYRLAYNGVAAAATVMLAVYVHRLPDRTLYQVRGGWRVPLAAVRVGALVCALAAAAEIGIGPFSGVSELLAYVGRRRALEAPEAQGPAMGEGGLKTGGPFRYVRHPLNASATAIVFATPKMTVVRLTVAMTMLLYSLVGSKIEEGRLLESYGEEYRRYRESGVPFFVPFFVPRLAGLVRWLRGRCGARAGHGGAGVLGLGEAKRSL